MSTYCSEIHQGLSGCQELEMYHEAGVQRPVWQQRALTCARGQGVVEKRQRREGVSVKRCEWMNCLSPEKDDEILLPHTLPGLKSSFIYFHLCLTEFTAV